MLFLSGQSSQSALTMKNRCRPRLLRVLCGAALVMWGASAQAQSTGLVLCPGPFALCAAATCKPTGGTIMVAGRALPAASCDCPILNGPSIADPNLGNMQGSCTPPPNGVWSLYALTSSPQQITTPLPWSMAPALPQPCPSGTQFAECWNFSCVKEANPQNPAVPLAKCTCPIEASSNAMTPAGLCNPSICSQLPVGAPIPFSSGFCSGTSS